MHDETVKGGSHAFIKKDGRTISVTVWQQTPDCSGNKHRPFTVTLSMPMRCSFSLNSPSSEPNHHHRILRSSATRGSTDWCDNDADRRSMEREKKKTQNFAHHSLKKRTRTRTHVMALSDPHTLLLLCLFKLPDALLLLEDLYACGSPAAVDGPVWIQLCFSGQSVKSCCCNNKSLSCAHPGTHSTLSTASFYSTQL